MYTSRLVALAVGGVLITLMAATAQQNPPGKQPQVKPGDPGKFPQVKPGDSKTPTDPNKGKNTPPMGMDPTKGKNPMPPLGMNPGTGLPPGVNPGVGQPPITPIPGQPMPPQPKKDIGGNWPKEINNKRLVDYVRDMREQSDPAVREAAIRTLPFFGPESHKLASKNLLYALTKDSDYNVRLAAMAVVPQLGFDEAEVTDGLNAVFNYLSHSSAHVRYETCLIVAQIGPFPLARKNAIPKLSAQAGDSTSWRVRQAAVMAIGSVGRRITNPENPEQFMECDAAAVETLLRSMRNDVSAPVRREAANSLVLVGPVSAAQVRLWRQSLETAIKSEKDKSVALWMRVALLKNDPLGIKANEAHLSVICSLLTAEEEGARLEACQALGVLGEDVRSKAKDLLDLVTNPKEDNDVVTAGLQALTAMKSQAALSVPVLEKVKTTHKSQDVRKLTEDVIDFLTDKKAPPKK